MKYVRLDDKLNPNHKAIHKSKSRELLVYGGANSGKTYSIADKLLLQSIWQGGVPIRCIVIRKTLPSLRRSAFYVLEKRADMLGLPFIANRGDWTARCGNVNFIFLSMNNEEDFQKLKSMTDIDFIWVNELPEIREQDYQELLLRARGGKAAYEQIIADFNPIGKTSWVYKRFWEHFPDEAEKLRYTIDSNHPSYLADPKVAVYIDKLKRSKEYDPNYYKIYFLGEWGELEGVIFNWDVVPKPAGPFDEIFYGGDFGFSINPAALVRVYRRGKELWLEEVIYHDPMEHGGQGLTNQELASEALRLGVKRNDETYWDSAEPKSIEELRRAGLNAKPCRKGSDSIRHGIDFLKSFTVHIIDGAIHLSREVRSYIWAKDHNGKSLDKPIARDNHGIDATRYAVTTHLHRARGFVAFSEEDFY